MNISIVTATYNRPTQLASTALASIQNQSERNFELVVVNDGANPNTKEIVTRFKASADFPVRYVEMEHPHPSSGFGLCYARNLGIDVATGDLVTYLDDDNSITSDFVASTRQYFNKHPHVRYSIVKQKRRRDIMENDRLIHQGKQFVSPSTDCCSLSALLAQQEIFDSNGFAHYRINAPKWNPQLKIFADYEYLLQAAQVWGENAFGFNNSILVNYIQSSTGIIGSSSYQQWATELSNIVANSCNYAVLQGDTCEVLKQFVEIYSIKAQSHPTPKAFSISPN